jgi:hypothetical protein
LAGCVELITATLESVVFHVNAPQDGLGGAPHIKVPPLKAVAWYCSVLAGAVAPSEMHAGTELAPAGISAATVTRSIFACTVTGTELLVMVEAPLLVVPVRVAFPSPPGLQLMGVIKESQVPAQTRPLVETVITFPFVTE